MAPQFAPTIVLEESVVTGCKGDNVLQDLSVSVLQAQTLSHIAGYKSVSVFQAVKMSVCCNA